MNTGGCSGEFQLETIGCILIDTQKKEFAEARMFCVHRDADLYELQDGQWQALSDFLKLYGELYIFDSVKE